MKQFSHFTELTDTELMEWMSQPLSEEDLQRYEQLDHDSVWLLTLNLHEMDNDEPDGDSDE